MIKLKVLCGQLYWLLRNLSRTITLKNIESWVDKEQELIYKGLDLKKINECSVLLSSLRSNKQGFNRVQKILYKIFSRKLVLIVLDKKTQKIVGLDQFYFNKRDCIEKTVHEGFIGVFPTYQGKGIATNMRLHMKKHFQKNGVKGLSSRISLNNKASLITAGKVGFQPVEKYYDQGLKEERYYLVCNLNVEKKVDIK